jgi:hypothetical protein
MPLANWTGEGDAQETEADIRLLIERFASPSARSLLASTPIYMARLDGASGHTAEEPGDQHGFVVYIDPFRATSRLHAAATLVHELTHVEHYLSRGFHANRAAAVMAREDFVLLGLADELGACEVEAAFVAAALKGLFNGEQQLAARTAMLSSELRWPAALLSLLGITGVGGLPREHIVTDLAEQAARYWRAHRHDRLVPELAAAIRNWAGQSAEWQDIFAQRDAWRKAGAVFE